jgi:hypothetical protein
MRKLLLVGSRHEPPDRNLAQRPGSDIVVEGSLNGLSPAKTLRAYGSRIPPPVRTSCLEDQNSAGPVRVDPVGEHTACRSSANDHEVELAVAHGPTTISTTRHVAQRSKHTRAGLGLDRLQTQQG